MTTIPGRYTSALGDKRERPVPCQSCRADTFALDGLCDRCFVDGLEDGTPLTIVTGNNGVLLGIEDSRFAGSIPDAGVVGLYRGRHPNPRLGADWLIVEVDAELVATLDSEGITFQATVVVPLHAGAVTRAADVEAAR